MPKFLTFEVFRAGDYGDKGKYSKADVAGIAKAYDPSIHHAPLTLDHAYSGPAMGWVEKAMAKGGVMSVRASLRDAMVDLLSDDAYKKVSVTLGALRETGQTYLYDVSFLGAMTPEVKSLAEPDPRQMEEFSKKFESRITFEADLNAAQIEFEEEPESEVLTVEALRAQHPELVKIIMKEARTMDELERLKKDKTDAETALATMTADRDAWKMKYEAAEGGRLKFEAAAALEKALGETKALDDAAKTALRTTFAESNDPKAVRYAVIDAENEALRKAVATAPARVTNMGGAPDVSFSEGSGDDVESLRAKEKIMKRKMADGMTEPVARRYAGLTAVLLALFLAFSTLAVAAPYSSGTAIVAGNWQYLAGDPLTFREIELTHPSHSDGFADYGDPVLIGDEGMVGVVRSRTADITAADSLVVIQGHGVANLSITAASAMTMGDAVYINKTTAALTDSPANSVKFGHVMAPLYTLATATVMPILVTGNTHELSVLAGFTGTGAAVFQSTVEIEGATSAGVVRASGGIHGAGGLVIEGASQFDGILSATTATASMGRVDSSKGVVITAGGLQVDTTSTLTGVVTASAQVNANGDLRVGSGGTVLDTVVETSTTIAGGATSCTVTVTSARADNSYVQFTLGNAAGFYGYTSHGYAKIETGGVIDIAGFTSTTAVAVPVYIRVMRKY